MRQGDLAGRRFTDDGLAVRGQMPSSECERMLKQAHDMGFRSWVTFYLMSEPFLDDRLIDMAQLAKSLGMRPFVNTNGDALRKRPDLLNASKQVFEFVQVGIYEPDPKKAQSDLVMWQRLLGPKLQTKRLSEMGPRPHVPRIGQSFPEATCWRPNEKLIVQYDGSSPLCCYDINAQWNLPNAFEVSLKDLWHNEARGTAAEILSKKGGRSAYDLCATCPMPARGFPKPFEDIL
jgi:hypothetical protein